MDKFTTHQGLVAPLDRENVDTDAIIPKQFLKSIKKTGFGPNLFDEWRYLDKGEPGIPESQRKPNPDFVLNQPRYAGASVLLARKNFGCGSSREHAPISIGAAGAKAVVAESYARIFFRNCIATGAIYPVESEGRVCDSAKTGDEAVLDMAAGTLTLSASGTVFRVRSIGAAKDVIDNGGLFEHARKSGMLK